MNRTEIIEICDQHILENAAQLFGTDRSQLKVYPGYEGAANLVYDYERNGIPMILRISYRPDRTAAQIQAELDFVEYLAQQGLRVSRPVLSRNGNWVEILQTKGIIFHVVSFHKGAGMRVPDNGYRYREDAPIEEYFYNWGATLGKMHALSKQYQPDSDLESRPDWFDLHQIQRVLETRLPAPLSRVRQRVQSLLAEIKSLPVKHETFGLIHGDFNDGNFTVNYANGEITVFDFDDCCYFFFSYELAAAWEGGIGRVMFCDLDQRRAFMDHYMETLLAGYQHENVLPDDSIKQLPNFICLLQVEELLHFLQYIESPDPNIQAGLRYKIKCIEEDIPFMGFFDPIYDPSNPFSIQ